MTAPGVFVDTSQNFQVNDEELRIVLTSQNQLHASAINAKDTGIYSDVEIVNSQTFFNASNIRNPYYVFRKCFSLGAVAAGASTTITHSITGLTQCTRIYGTCITDVVDYRPIPYASVTANANIEINVNSTQITIANGAASPNITSGLVVLEYLKT